MGNTTHHAMIPQTAPERAYVTDPGSGNPLNKYFELSYDPK